MATRLHADTQEFPSDTPVTVVVRIGGGTVRARAEEITSAFVTVTPYDDSDASRATAANTRVEFSGGRLHIEAPDGMDGGRLFRRNGRVHVELRVPVGSALQARTGSGDVITDGTLGDVSVQTGSGDAVVAKTTGELSMNAGSGDLRAMEVGGSLRAHTGSGDLSIVIVRGEVNVHTASGDIRIDDATGNLHATTASGDVRIDSAAGEQVQVKTASGDVVVGVPTGTRVWLDLGTVSGTTHSELEMTGGSAEPGTFVTLQVHTVSGDINVRRATAPRPRTTD